MLHSLLSITNVLCNYGCLNFLDPKILTTDMGFSYLRQILAIPAIPLTMSAGLLFGTVTGTIIVSISGTVSYW